MKINNITPFQNQWSLIIKTTYTLHEPINNDT